MIVLYPLVVGIAFAVLWRRRDRAGGRGWRWFGAWSVAGWLLTFSYLTGFSIGPLVFPLAVAALFFVTSRAPHFAESIGFVGGVGGVALLVALLNRDYNPCDEHGRLSIPPGAPPGTSVSCGGVDAEPWLNAGVLTSCVCVAGYAVLRWRRRPDADKGAEAQAACISLLVRRVNEQKGAGVPRGVGVSCSDGDAAATACTMASRSECARAARARSTFSMYRS